MFAWRFMAQAEMRLSGRNSHMSFFRIVLTALLAVVLSATAVQAKRDEIRIVGSSTVYPFSSYVAEKFGASTEYPTPIVESTGSGGGLKLFCAGDDFDTPDITNASRAIKLSEFDNCKANGVDGIIEVAFGFDGIAFAQKIHQQPFAISLHDLAMAVVAEVPRAGTMIPNPYTNWNQINPDLPDRDIIIYGPPSTSGTRDAFAELVLEPVTKEIAGYNGAYTRIRGDDVYVPSGENDEIIVERLADNPVAFGIFGYSFLEENIDRLQGAVVAGVEPTMETISSGEYPLSRKLFFYVKTAHIEPVPGVADYVDMFLSDMMAGQEGLLIDIGLVPLPEDALETQRGSWESREPLTRGQVKDY
jgi:phosphate transport system substrate-binding protein